MKTILIRVDEDFKKEIEGKAKELKLSVSGFIRTTLQKTISNK